MKPWFFGNTTVRNPYRLQGALQVLAESSLNGDLSGKDKETAFAELLHDKEVVYVARIAEGGNEDYSDLGRKWRSALSQLGFITPLISRKSRLDDSGRDTKLLGATDSFVGLSGNPYQITPNGKRLIEAESTTAMQEVFLRSMLSYQIPSDLESLDDLETSLSPLRLVLTVLKSLEQTGVQPHISYQEFTLFVSFANHEDQILKVVEEIKSYRENKAKAENKKRFYRTILEECASLATLQANTIDTYTNLTLRYLKATGLFASKGRGILLAQEKLSLINQLLEQPFIPLGTIDTNAYLTNLWKGARLPTDESMGAIEQIKEIIAILESKNQPLLNDLPNLNQTSQEDLSRIRLDLLEQVGFAYEEDYAAEQAQDWQEIHDYMQALITKKGNLVPSNERPAYLEWTLWRAFLAINSLQNKPWEARQFKIDQDFLPVGTAPGGRPDMYFEFDDYVLVVEVTLMQSSRQEAAEGEPVRRHVAKYQTDYKGKKDVYGLFIANVIDSNTAATFKIGLWYLNDGTELSLDIVPVPLKEFALVFKSGFEKGHYTPTQLKSLLQSCLGEKGLRAPEWKEEIIQKFQNAAI